VIFRFPPFFDIIPLENRAGNPVLADHQEESLLSPHELTTGTDH